MFTLRRLSIPGIFAVSLLTGVRPAPQSGRALMHGYVAFDDFSYNDVTEGKIHATVELRATGEGNHGVYKAETDRHGSYDFPSIGLGEYTLRITAPGHKPYQADLYFPSDFEGRLAVLLKKS